jgi:molybdenum cofactor cytidylyltransferase
MPDESGCAAVILAAGRSERMGRDKRFVEWEGEPLLRRAVRVALEADLAPVVVVSRPDDPELPALLDGLPCELVSASVAGGPISGSLRAGFAALPDAVTGAMVILPDMPRVTADMLRMLADAGASGQWRGVGSQYGDVTGPPVWFARNAWPLLLASEGDGVGKRVLAALKDEATWLEWPEDRLWDVDRPEDLGVRARGCRPERSEGEG